MSNVTSNSDIVQTLTIRSYPELQGRREGRAMRKHLRKLTKEHAPSNPARSRSKDTRDTEQDDLPYVDMVGRWGKVRAPMWSPVGARTPMHVTSASDITVLTPFVAAPTDLLAGPAAGLTTAGDVFTFDPWSVYDAQLATSNGVCTWGTMGGGKTFATQVIIDRLIHYGRHVIVENDPKGEWVALARARQGTVIQLGPGATTRANPFAASTARAAFNDQARRQQLAAHRGTMLRQILSVMRGEFARFSEEEESAITHIVEAMDTGRCRPSVPGVVEYLTTPPTDLVDLVGQVAPHQIYLSMRRLTSGPLAGMVDAEESDELDPASPIIVVDTSLLLGVDETIKAIARVCAQAWVDALLQCGDGRFRIVLNEEAWAALRNKYSAQAIDERLRMQGHWRCCSWLVFHELNDIGQMASDQQHLEMVRGIISKSPIKGIFPQAPSALAMFVDFVQPTPSELMTVQSLRPHHALWRLGEKVSAVVHVEATPAQFELFDNSSSRAG